MERSEIIAAVATDLTLEQKRVKKAVELLDGGNSIPFIARYRKEATDSLDEEELRQIDERLRYRRNLEERRETILRSMQDQDVLTPERAESLAAADTLRRLEDLYRPFKPKRRTRATMAREKGLEPLAALIRTQALTEKRHAAAQPYLSNEAVASIAEAYAGARDIVAEIIADDPQTRGEMRELAQQKGRLQATETAVEQDPKGTYRTYYDFSSSLDALRPHQILALNRAEREQVLKLGLEIPAESASGILAKYYPTDYGSPFADDLLAAREDGFQRLLFPAIEREARSALAAMADAHAIEVFATNLRSLLLQPPLRGQTVMGIDPGIRTGCKVAVVDPTGKVLDTATIYPDRHPERAKTELRRLGKRHQVTVIAIGNGTASRETERLIADLLRAGARAKYTIVNEAGASVYSASRLAGHELPDLDVTLRGAVSIARRLQDPLAELVKIDPQAIGVGLYQHDVNQTALAEALNVVVESVVHNVGIDLNTASSALLQHISGIGPKTAEAIVAYRNEHGPFATRAALQDVSGIGPKTFEQAAGFLRVPEGEEPLDNTPIHPESYPAARALLSRLETPIGDPELVQKFAAFRSTTKLAQLAAELETGIPTLEDILDALARPGRDPRDELAGPILRGDILKIEDLHEGLQLRGTVRNVVDFGAFVDIGVKRAGLIHISQLGSEYVRDPHDKVSVGDIVQVTVINLDLERGRIGLKLQE